MGHDCCCVVNCKNNGLNSKCKFYIFPRAPYKIEQRKKWIDAVKRKNVDGTQWSPKPHDKICSEHFIGGKKSEEQLSPSYVPTIFPTIYRKKKVNQSQVEIDTDNSVQCYLVEEKIKMAPENQAEIKVCRICLSVDVKMYDMTDFKLNEMFTKITGIAVYIDTKSALHRVCWECAARLTAASAFREKALLSDALLKSLVHINKREIEQLKQCYSQLKPTLTIQTVPTSIVIETGNTIPQQESPSDQPKKKRTYKRNTKPKVNTEEETTVFETEEPLIGIPVKTEIEFDPIAENDMNIQVKEEQCETFGLANFDDSSMNQDQESNDGISSTEVRIDNNDKREDNTMSYAVMKEEVNIADEYNQQQQMLDAIDNILDDASNVVSKMNASTNDSDIVLEENAKKRPNLDAVGNTFDLSSREGAEMDIEPNDDSNIVLAEDNVGDDSTLDDIDEFSSEEDAQSLAELASIKKAKKQTKKKIRASNIGPNRLNHLDKQKIITLKEKGVSMTEIAKKIGKSESCITAWWQRYSQEDIKEYTTEGNRTEHRKTAGTNNLEDDYPPHVIRKLTEAGFEHLLKKNLDDKNTEQKKSKFGAKSDSLKRQIVALKEAGVNTSHTAILLGTTRNSVRLWWNRWCNEGILTEREKPPKKRKTTAEEDHLIRDRVAQSESVHIPSVAKEFGVSAQEEKRKELKRIKTNARQRAYYQRQKDLKKNEEIIKKVPKSNAERQREFRQRNAEKSYMDMSVRRRLKEAGFKRKLIGPYIPLNAGRTKKVDEDLKQKILTMKQNGVPVNEIAMTCRVPRTTIYQWWRRWCKENNIEANKNDVNDATEEGPSLTEDAKIEKTGQIPKKLSKKKALFTKFEIAEKSKNKPE